MAIVNGRRIKGIQFYKAKGRQDYYFVDDWTDLYGSVVSLNTRDPRGERFHYCSAIAQPVFVDYLGKVDREFLNTLRPVTWAKVPEGWQALFADRLDLPV